VEPLTFKPVRATLGHGDKAHEFFGELGHNRIECRDGVAQTILRSRSVVQLVPDRRNGPALEVRKIVPRAAGRAVSESSENVVELIAGDALELPLLPRPDVVG